MNAELKRLHSPDIQDLQSYKPDIPDNFSFLLQAMVGPEGLPGEESFDIDVCSLKWLETNHGISDVIFCQHRLIFQEYNYQLLIKTIIDYLKTCSGKDWGVVATKVSRLGKWEFEDYGE